LKEIEMKNPPNTIDPAMQATIAARVEAIRQAHANNLIEGLNAGADVVEAMLQRAREPISNEEFTRREKALWLQRHTMSAVLEPNIDEQERTRRQADIDYARRSVRLEGFILSPEIEEINRRFINGELTGDEHIKAIEDAVLHG
jgi:hypothetical protein